MIPIRTDQVHPAVSVCIRRYERVRGHLVCGTQDKAAVADGFSAAVPSHGVVMIRVSK